MRYRILREEVSGVTLTQFLRTFVSLAEVQVQRQPLPVAGRGRSLSSHLTRACASGCVPILLMTHTAPHCLIQRRACHGEDGSERRFWMGLQWPAAHVQKKRNPGWEHRFIRRQSRIGRAAAAWLRVEMEVCSFPPPLTSAYLWNGSRLNLFTGLASQSARPRSRLNWRSNILLRWKQFSVVSSSLIQIWVYFDYMWQ